MNNSIKVICFDLDGVYFTPKGKNSFHQALISEYGVAKEVVDDIMYRSVEMSQLIRGQISAENFWKVFREVTGIAATDKELADRWIRDYEVDKNVRNAVLRAKELGYKTCVCTNNNAIRLNPLIEKFHLRDDFDCIISSHEIGHAKPEKDIFIALLDRMIIEPQELVYSDDNPDRLSGAEALGIHTFVFKDFEHFLEKLSELGINLR